MLFHRIVEKLETDSGKMEIEFIDENEIPSYKDLEQVEMDRRLVKKVRKGGFSLHRTF